MNTTRLPAQGWLQRIKVVTLVGVCLLGLSTSVSWAQSLGLALDNTNLSWSTSGTGNAFGWSASANAPHTGASDASSGGLSTADTTSTLQTTVTGPGTLGFWWRTSSATCQLSLVSGKQTLATYGGPFTSWQSATFYLPAGTQTLKWTYSVSSPPSDYKAAYVDGVTYTAGPTPAFIIQQPWGQSQVKGLDATMAVSAGGTPPLSFQWQLNGQPLPGATNSSLVVTNVDASKAGNYSVVLTNSFGSATSSNAPLELGQVTAWGLPGFGATTVPAGATNVLAISAGSYFGLMLKAGGQIVGWGNPQAGAAPPATSDTIAISAGLQQGLALRRNQTVVAWGDNTYGNTNVPDGLTAVARLGKSFSSCVALVANGSPVAWGDGYTGETNIPPEATNLVQVVAGGFAGLALRSDGTVIQWGGSTSPPALSNIVAIAAGAAHYLALSGDGTVTAWGQNDQGQANVPYGLSNVVAIAAGSRHSLALRSDGTVQAWGTVSGGLDSVPPGLTNVIAIAAGDYQSVALVGDGPPVLQTNLFNPSWSDAGFSAYIPSESGRVYQLQFKTATVDQNWVSLPLVPGTGKPVQLIDPSAGEPDRIYRVLRW